MASFIATRTNLHRHLQSSPSGDQVQDGILHGTYACRILPRLQASILMPTLIAMSGRFPSVSYIASRSRLRRRGPSKLYPRISKCYWPEQISMLLFLEQRMAANTLTLASSCFSAMNSTHSKVIILREYYVGTQAVKLCVRTVVYSAHMKMTTHLRLLHRLRSDQYCFSWNSLHHAP